MAMCAPVSPPVVVVFVKSKPRWSCEMVTTMTLAMVMTVMAPGTHHHWPRPDRRARADGAEDGASDSFDSSTLTIAPTVPQPRARGRADPPGLGARRSPASSAHIRLNLSAPLPTLGSGRPGPGRPWEAAESAVDQAQGQNDRAQSTSSSSRSMLLNSASIFFS